MKMSSSEMGPAVMPSGGEEVRVRYSWKRRLDAIDDAIVEGGWWLRWCGGGEGGGEVYRWVSW